MSNLATQPPLYPIGRCTPLHIAVRKSQLEMVALLIADLDTQDGQGRTPLMVAAVNYLLEQGADTWIKDKRGKVPLERVEADWNRTM